MIQLKIAGWTFWGVLLPFFGQLRLAAWEKLGCKAWYDRARYDSQASRGSRSENWDLSLSHRINLKR